MKWIFLFLTLCLLQFAPIPVFAQLPADNLIQNPCFADGLNGWVNPSGRWVARTGEEKNPSPCGDAESPVAKLGPQRFNGAGEPGVTDYLYQVVQADAGRQTAVFSLNYIAVRVDVFQVNIYGSDSADGAWTLVWVPVSLQGTHEGFDQAVTAETKLDRGYPYYKIEFQGQFTEGLGMKVTGVHFAVSGESIAPAATLPPIETIAPSTAVPATPTSQLFATSAPNNPTSTPATATPPPTNPPPQQPPDLSPSNSGWLWGVISAVLLLLGIGLVIAWWGMRRHR